MRKLIRTGTRFSAMIVALATSAAIAQTHSGEIYTWTDDKGTVNFSERKPEGVDATLVGISPPPQASPATSPYATVEDTPSPGAQARIERQAREAQAAETASIRQQLEASCDQANVQIVGLESRPNALIREDDGSTRRMDDDERLAKIDELKDYVAENCD